MGSGEKGWPSPGGGGARAERRVCLVTCRKLGGLIAEDERLREALIAHGWSVAVAAWDDPGQRWSGYDAVVVRTTWDYHLRAEAFRAWVDGCAADGVALWNPAPALLWNLHKSYLLDLAGRGVAVVPTALVAAGAAPGLGDLLESWGWDEVVVKPAISATAWRTFRTRLHDARADQARFAELTASGDALVQPFVPEVAASGEISFVFFDGHYSHAALKQAAPGDFRVQEEYGGRSRSVAPPAGLVEEARRVSAALPHPWLYARIDAAVREDRLMVMEVELIEPQLFFGLEPGAAERFSRALGRQVARGRAAR